MREEGSCRGEEGSCRGEGRGTVEGDVKEST